MKQNKISRRQILLQAGAAGGLSLQPNILKKFLNSHVRSLIEESRSKYLSNRLSIQKARNFVQFNLYGGPSRWYFDNVLRPNDSDPFIQAAGVYNRFTNIDVHNPHLIRAEYRDVKIRGFNMPYLWQFNVAKSKGGVRAMSELMSNMLIIRGGLLDSEAHPINCERQVSPVPGDYSITGLVADATGVLMPAISVGHTPANRAYKSPLKTGVLKIPPESSNYISFLLEAFNQKENLSAEKDIENALGVLEKYGNSNQPGSEILYNERRRAESMIRSGVKNLAEVFPALNSKYEDLFDRSMRTAIPGITDRPVPGIRFPFEMPGNLELDQTLAPFMHDSNILTMSDYREMYAGAKSENLSQYFALAEFLLTEGLSSSILLAPPSERGTALVTSKKGLTYPQSEVEKKFDAVKNSTTFSIKKNPRTDDRELSLLHDSHGTGWVPSLIGYNQFYLGLSSCLLELIDRLKATKIENTTLFNETVIQVASEFDRFPTQLGAGTEHNSSAYVTSFFSGIIQQPTVLGNVFVGRPKGGYHAQGTIGDSAPVPSLINHNININNVSSTLSEMLRVPKIVPRAASLVAVKNEKLEPLIEPARNIENRHV